MCWILYCWVKKEDGDTESYQYSRVIQDSVFLCRKMGSINGYFVRYIISFVPLI